MLTIWMKVRWLQWKHSPFSFLVSTYNKRHTWGHCENIKKQEKRQYYLNKIYPMLFEQNNTMSSSNVNHILSKTTLGLYWTIALQSILLLHNRLSILYQKSLTPEVTIHWDISMYSMKKLKDDTQQAGLW